MKKDSFCDITLEELRIIAAKNGVKIDKRWKKETILLELDMAGIIPCHVSLDNENVNLEKPDYIVEADEIVSAIPVKKECVKIKNLSKNKYEIGGISISSLETIEIPESKINDLDFMKRINRHIEIKKFKIVK